MLILAFMLGMFASLLVAVRHNKTRNKDRVQRLPRFLPNAAIVKADATRAKVPAAGSDTVPAIYPTSSGRSVRSPRCQGDAQIASPSFIHARSQANLATASTQAIEVHL